MDEVKGRGKPSELRPRHQMESTDEARRNHRDSQAGVMCDGAGMTGAPGRIKREETRVGKSIQEGKKGSQVWKFKPAYECNR